MYNERKQRTIKDPFRLMI